MRASLTVKGGNAPLPTLMVAIGAAALVLVLAGCGGGGGSPAAKTAGTPTTARTSAPTASTSAPTARTSAPTASTSAGGNPSASITLTGQVNGKLTQLPSKLLAG